MRILLALLLSALACTANASGLERYGQNAKYCSYRDGSYRDKELPCKAQCDDDEVRWVCFLAPARDVG